MSYCVNCGVELKNTEKSCPLCNTVVINPNATADENVHDQPQKDFERIPSLTPDYKLLSTIISVILIIPVAITFICDYMQSHTITWSLYVLSAIALAFVTMFLPAFFKNKKPYKFIVIDAVAVFLFLWLICTMTHGKWAFSVGLPLVGVTCVFSLIYALAIRSKKTSKLLKISLLIIMIGVFVLCIEIILNDAFRESLALRWSHFVMIPCGALSVILLIIDSQKKLKEELQKKLFM